MKKISVFLLSVIMIVCTFSIGVFAESEEKAVDVYVTIIDEGNIEIAYKKLSVNDADVDGEITVNDALLLAHKECYSSGVEGYESYYGDYGLSLGKLWGNESGSYGYYLNNGSCFSLEDKLSDGDYVCAFIYATDDWSDTYSFFDINASEISSGDNVTLTLSAAGYDADWKPVVFPIENATITVDGEVSEYKTDTDGKVTFSVEKTGQLVISAVSEDMTLVPPVCVLSVKGAESESASETHDTSATTTKSGETDSQESGCSGSIAESSVLFITLTTLSTLGCSRKRKNEK